jgi:hypothetical protein
MFRVAIAAGLCVLLQASQEQAERFNQTLGEAHEWGEDPVSAVLFAHPGLAISCLLLIILTLVYLWKGEFYAVNAGKDEEIRVLMRPKAELYPNQQSVSIPLRKYGTFRELPYHDA